MSCEIKSVYSAGSQLQKIVVQALFADANHGCCVLKRVSHQLYAISSVWIRHSDAVVEFAPHAHFFDDFSHSSFFSSNYFTALFALNLCFWFITIGFAHAAHSWLHQPLLLELLYFPIFEFSISLFLLFWLVLLRLLSFINWTLLLACRVLSLTHVWRLIFWLIALDFCWLVFVWLVFDRLFGTALLFVESLEFVNFAVESLWEMQLFKLSAVVIVWLNWRDHWMCVSVLFIRNVC